MIKKYQIIRIVVVVILIILDILNLVTFAGGFMIHRWIQRYQSYRLHLFFSLGKRMDRRYNGLCEVENRFSAVLMPTIRLPGENKMFSG